MNMNKLRAKIVERETNVEELATRIGITGPTLYRKMKMPMKMTIGEAIQIKDVLELTDEEALKYSCSRLLHHMQIGRRYKLKNCDIGMRLYIYAERSIESKSKMRQLDFLKK